MKLTEFDIEEGFVVDNVETQGEIRQRIIEMGFTAGAKGWIVRKAPLGDPIQVHIMDYEISLRKSEANGIEVSKADVEIKKMADIKTGKVKKEKKNNTCDLFLEDKEEISKKLKVPSNNTKLKVAIAGNPNCGKTTIFNALTGANYKVANYPGVTVEKREHSMLYNGYTYDLIDLPGVYSLSAYSQDEVVACDVLLNEKPDFIIDVIDSTNLERNLYLTLQLVELGIPILCVLNMYEYAENEGIIIDEAKLEELFRLPVMKVHGNKHESVLLILDKIEKIYESGNKLNREAALEYGADVEESIKNIVSSMQGDISDIHKRWLAIKALEKDERAIHSVRRECSNGGEVIETINKEIIKLETKENSKTDSIMADKRYSYIRGALKEVIKRDDIQAFNFTDAADVVFLNKWLGIPIFLGVLWLIFKVTFTLGAYPQGWIEMGIGALSSFVSNLLPEGSLLQSVVVDGVIGGVGAVLSFFPLVLILFVGISFLEDCGYMARAAFLMDKVMHKFGLHGQSFIPMFLGFGCTIPATMAARTLRNKKDRIVTVLITTFMSCGARIPVYVLFTAAFFSPKMAPTVMFSIYIIGVIMAFLVAFILRKLFFKGDETPFVMELPPYRVPRVKTVLRHMFDRGWMYIKKAGTYVFAASVLIWALMTFPQYNPTEKESLELMDRAKTVLISENIDINDEEALNDEYDRIVASEGLRHSFAGKLGTFIEPVMKPLGFDWRISIALIAGGAAKEVFVSTIAQIKSIEEDETTLIEALRNDPVFNPIVAYALLLFVLLYFPCFASIAVIGSEIGKAWIPFLIVYTLAVAWIVSFAFYQIAGRIAGII
ncbi:ferrous iron transport protein B [Brachyspira pilosicoli]|uniref:Ferrous iron transport protein B n=1 Tax=Brachyspira pilosicoli TaxID=52584 RepID=A0A5C8ERS0_BRAPL|nr:ferrous iron transport protein B [Brachyspira pilosicoli]TXJ39784.1 ferrous iron transport protein B [Brachyspira pilosicoli]